MATLALEESRSSSFGGLRPARKRLAYKYEDDEDETHQEDWENRENQAKYHTRTSKGKRRKGARKLADRSYTGRDLKKKAKKRVTFDAFQKLRLVDGKMKSVAVSPVTGIHVRTPLPPPPFPLSPG